VKTEIKVNQYKDISPSILYYAYLYYLICCISSVFNQHKCIRGSQMRQSDTSSRWR